MFLFKGLATAMITPFTKDNINYDEFFRLVDFQISSGVDAIVVAGTTGEPSTMTDEEYRTLIRRAVEYAKGKILVIAGSGGNNTSRAVETSKYCESVGADAVLCVTPYYNKCTKNGIVEYYKTICDAIKLPVIAYNVPQRTGVNITPAVAARLAELPQIAGLKEASNDFVQIAETAFLLDGKCALYCGDDETILPFLSLGSSGTISVLSNVMPKETKELHNRYFAGDIKGAYAMYRRLYPFANSLFIEVNPIPCKAALNAMGYDTKILRAPLTEMEEENKQKLFERMRFEGLIK